MSTADVRAREELFWELAVDLLTEPSVSRSTMMGYPCLRLNGAFFACVERGTGHLIVKLPAERVSELVFHEWAAFPDPDRDKWVALLDEARAFVDT